MDKTVIFKYPKFTMLALTFLAAWLILSERSFVPFRDLLASMGYAGTFIAGFFYANGFTGAPATAVLLILSDQQNFILAGVIAGLGSLAADLIIFKMIRHSFTDEVNLLSRERFVVAAGLGMGDLLVVQEMAKAYRMSGYLKSAAQC